MKLFLSSLLITFIFIGCSVDEDATIDINTTSQTYLVTGTITGLTGSITLLLNGQSTTINKNGPFTFSGSYATGFVYTVLIDLAPDTQLCVLNNATGTINTINVPDINVTCKDSGSLDTNFGTQGIASIKTSIADGNMIEDSLIDSQQRIIALDEEGRINRFLSDGSVDRNFNGIGSFALTPHDPYSLWRLAIDSQNRVYVLESWVVSSTFSTVVYDYQLLRLNSSGIPDTSFGNSGFLNISGEEGVNLLVDSNDQLVLLCSNRSSSKQYAYIKKYLLNGTLDVNFGTNGVFNLSVSTNYYQELSSIYEDRNGDYFILGYIEQDIDLSSNYQFQYAGALMFKITNSGTLDSSFSSDGMIWDTSIEYYSGLTFDDFNNLILSGATLYADNGTGAFLAFLTPSGVINDKFANNGYLIIKTQDSYVWFGNPIFDSLFNTIYVASLDRKRISGGFAYSRKIHKYALNGSVNSTFGVDGNVSVADTSIIGSSLHSFDNDSLITVGYHTVNEPNENIFFSRYIK